jgi:carbamoylphosphate synthase large subunit
MSKKILILAGTYFQIPVIEYAKMKGHYVITCDNRPDNPGHRISDEYFNLSTTDIKGVLDLAENKNIDGILAFGTDPAAPTAAFVSEKLRLPGNSYSSVQTLSDKGLFRKFLSENNFSVPVSKVFKAYNEANNFYKTLKGNVFVKPVDSSGSKGISKLKPGSELKTAFFYALEFSRKREIIIEEEIKRYGPHIHGEAFIHKGEVVFCLFGDQYFSRVQETAPMSTTVPSIFHSDIMPGIKNELSRIIELTGFNTGGLNVELIRGDDDRIYFIEIGARSGGNFMPELIRQASGFDLAAASVNAALNEQVDLTNHSGKDQFWSQLILHSPGDGIFSGYALSLFEDIMIFKKEYFSPGDQVNAYRDSRHVMGVHIYYFDELSLYNMFLDYIMANDLVFVNQNSNDQS